MLDILHSFLAIIAFIVFIKTIELIEYGYNEYKYGLKFISPYSHKMREDLRHEFIKVIFKIISTALLIEIILIAIIIFL